MPKKRRIKKMYLSRDSARLTKALIPVPKLARARIIKLSHLAFHTLALWHQVFSTIDAMAKSWLIAVRSKRQSRHGLASVGVMKSDSATRFSHIDVPPHWSNHEYGTVIYWLRP